jgi:hypothetical protein
VNKPTLQTQVTAMKKYNWEVFSDEDIEDEITLIKTGMKDLQQEEISEAQRQKIADEYLDKLNTLYNEQRKRGTFKSNIG